MTQIRMESRIKSGDFPVGFFQQGSVWPFTFFKAELWSSIWRWRRYFATGMKRPCNSFLKYPRRSPCIKRGDFPKGVSHRNSVYKAARSVHIFYIILFNWKNQKPFLFTLIRCRKYQRYVIQVVSLSKKVQITIVNHVCVLNFPAVYVLDGCVGDAGRLERARRWTRRGLRFRTGQLLSMEM